MRTDAAAHHVPGVCAFDFVANADAARAQDAAVVIDDEPVVSAPMIAARNVRSKHKPSRCGYVR